MTSINVLFRKYCESLRKYSNMIDVEPSFLFCTKDQAILVATMRKVSFLAIANLGQLLSYHIGGFLGVVDADGIRVS